MSTSAPRAHHRLTSVAAGAILVLVLLVGCSVATDTSSSTGSARPGSSVTTTSSTPRSTGAPTSTTTTRVGPPAPVPVNYSRPGPYEVGLTSISLGDRSVEVFYPASPDGLAALERITSYRPGDAYPPEVAALLAATVPSLVDPIALDAYRDAPINDEGPFPIILQSHGAGGSNLYASQHLRQEASWGFVVAAPDHRSRNQVAAVTTMWGGTPTDVDDLANTLTALVAANADPASVLSGGLDTQRIGAEGHSAGAAATYLFALSEPRVKVWIGQAPAPASTPPGASAPLDRPAMIVAADADTLVPLTIAQSQFDGLSAPKRMIVVAGAGHATFLDRCQAIRTGGGLAPFAEAYPQLGPLLQGTGDGCSPANIDPAVAGELINHVMIAQYRIAFGDDRTDVSLDPAYLSRTFPVAFGSEQATPPQATLAPVGPATTSTTRAPVDPAPTDPGPAEPGPAPTTP